MFPYFNGSESGSLLVLNLLVISGVLLTLGAILVAWIKQPVERIAIIKFTWGAVLVASLAASFPVIPQLELAVLGVLGGNQVSQIARSDQSPWDRNSSVMRRHSVPSSAQQVDSIASRESDSSSNPLSKVSDRAKPKTSPTAERAAAKSRSPVAWVTVITALAVASGCLIQIVYLGFSWILTRRMIAQARPLSTEQQARVEAIMNEIILKKPSPKYASSESIHAPLVYGLFDPVIVLPRRMLEANAGGTLEHALAHEWGHILNRDLGMLTVANVLQCFLWMHPAFWILRREQRLIQDQLADQVAVRHSGRAIDYAELLLQMIDTRSPLHCSALSMTDRPSSLRKRIQMVLDDQHSPATRSRQVVTLTCLLLIFLSGMGLASVRLVAAEMATKDFLQVDVNQDQQEPSAKRQDPEKEEIQEPQSSDKKEVKTEIRGRKIRVVDTAGKPVQGVEFNSAIFNRSSVIQMEGLSKSALTNENGEGEALYPFRAGDHTYEIHVVTLSLSHADYMSVFSEVPIRNDDEETPFEIVISPGIRVTLKAVDDVGEPFKGSIDAIVSGENAPSQWTRDIPGELSCRTMAPGPRQILLTHEDPQGMRYFSNAIFHQFDIEKQKEVVLDNIEMLPGIAIGGKFSDKVPRPIKNGVVIALHVPMPAGNSISELPSVQFFDWCEVKEDGRFGWKSMPRTGKIQLISICDGWTGLVGESGHFIEGQLFDVNEKPLEVELDLLPTFDAKVRLVDEAGKPLSGLPCGITTTQKWFLDGSTMLGVRHRSMDKPDRNGKMFPGALRGFHGETDKYGEIMVRNIPQNSHARQILIDGGEGEKLQLPEEGKNYTEQTIVVRRWDGDDDK